MGFIPHGAHHAVEQDAFGTVYVATDQIGITRRARTLPALREALLASAIPTTLHDSWGIDERCTAVIGWTGEVCGAPRPQSHFRLSTHPKEAPDGR